MHNEHDKENRAIMMTVKNKLPNKEERERVKDIYIHATGMQRKGDARQEEKGGDR